MKKLVFLFMLSLLLGTTLSALTAGDIAIIAVHTDTSKYLSFVALVDIPSSTTISFTDNAWDATNQSWRSGEGTIQWSHTSQVSKGSVITLGINASPYSASIGSVTTHANFNLSASGDQVLAYEGTTAPTTNSSSIWLFGYSTRNFAYGSNSNSSDIPTALTSYSVAMTSSTTDFDNSYFANGSTSQSSVEVTGTQEELLALFTDDSKYYKDNTATSLPTYTITVNTGGVSAPTVQAKDLTFTNVQQNQMDVSWTNGDGGKRVVLMNTTNTFTTPVDGTDPGANPVYGGSGQQVVYNNSGNTVTVSGLNASTNYWFRVYEYNGTGTGTKYFGDTAANNPKSQQTAAPSPIIELSESSLSGFTYEVGFGPSDENTFTVQGSNLTADISITAPDNYQISKTSGSNFASSLNFARSGSSVAEQTVYVRLIAGLSVGTYNGETITASSSGATNQTVTCNGSVTPTAYAVIDLYDATTEDFNDLTSGTWTNGTTKTGWYAKTDITPTITAYAANTGSTTTGALYAFGVEGTNPLSDRALGLISSNGFTGSAGSGKGYLGWRLKNTTGTTIDKLTVTWTGEQWRKENNANQHTLELYYQIGSVVDNPTSGTWTSANSVFTTPIYGATSAVVLDGNSASNREADKTVYLSGLNLADGQEIMLRWEDLNDSGNDHAMAIDDVSVRVTYDYPNGDDVIVGDITVTVTNGNANNSTGTLPAWPNGDVAEGTYDSLILDLLGAGPWTITILSDAYYCAYSQGTGWNLATPVSGGFEIEVDAPVKGEPLYILLSNEDPTLPVELSSFTVAMNAYNAAVLTWVTQTETGVNGFFIYRGTTDQLSEATLVSNLIPATNTSQTQVYRYSDSELFSEGTYYYWLNVNDMDGSESFHGPVTLVYETGENPTPSIPQVTELKSIYPNPFNPSANISFGLAKSSDVEFKIYNSRGQMVRNMALGVKDAGTWNLVWNGTDNNGRAVPTGIYYIQMQAGKDSFIRKAVMMK